MTQLFGAVGQCVLAGMIYFIRDWRLAQLITAAPFAVISIYIWCALPLSLHSHALKVIYRLFKSFTVHVSHRFIPESARWLLGRGRIEEAKQLITKVAAINNRPISESLLENVLILT